MKQRDIECFIGKNVEITLRPDATKTSGVLNFCNEDHIEINGELWAYPLIWGIRIIAAPVNAPEAKTNETNVYAQALAYAQKGQEAKAEEFYIRAIIADDHRKQAVNVLFGMFMKHGEYKKAKALLADYGNSLDEDTLMHHRTAYFMKTKEDSGAFIKLFARKIKYFSKSGDKRRFTYVRNKANLELSLGRYLQAVTTCNTGLEMLSSLPQPLPEELERFLLSIKRIKAIALHEAGSKKAVTLAKELMNNPSMRTDAKLLAILELAE